MTGASFHEWVLVACAIAWACLALFWVVLCARYRRCPFCGGTHPARQRPSRPPRISDPSGRHGKDNLT